MYQKAILEHNRNPRGEGPLPGATHSCPGLNRVCGDGYTLYLKVNDGRLEDITFEGSGCAISKASTSMMIECLKGKAMEEVQSLIKDFMAFMKGADPSPGLGELKVLDGVRAHGSRIKCATLSWRAVEGALEGEAEVNTESI